MCAHRHAHTHTHRSVTARAETSGPLNGGIVWGALMCCFDCPCPPAPRNSLKNTISQQTPAWSGALRNCKWRPHRREQLAPRKKTRQNGWGGEEEPETVCVYERAHLYAHKLIEKRSWDCIQLSMLACNAVIFLVRTVLCCRATEIYKLFMLNRTASE